MMRAFLYGMTFVWLAVAALTPGLGNWLMASGPEWMRDGHGNIGAIFSIILLTVLFIVIAACCGCYADEVGKKKTSQDE